MIPISLETLNLKTTAQNDSHDGDKAIDPLSSKLRHQFDEFRALHSTLADDPNDYSTEEENEGSPQQSACHDQMNFCDKGDLSSPSIPTSKKRRKLESMAIATSLLAQQEIDALQNGIAELERLERLLATSTTPTNNFPSVPTNMIYSPAFETSTAITRDIDTEQSVNKRQKRAEASNDWNQSHEHLSDIPTTASNTTISTKLSEPTYTVEASDDQEVKSHHIVRD